MRFDLLRQRHWQADLSYYFKKSSHGGKNFGLRISDCGFRNPHSAIRNGLPAKPALSEDAADYRNRKASAHTVA
jgi:hypothetical protein